MGQQCSGGSSTADKRKKAPANKPVNEEIHGFVDALPPGATEATVDHVYDGDTLTIVQANGEKHRVRLLGIDAPELKEKEDFSAQSAELLRKLCGAGKKVWLTFEAEKTDKYDRLLAWVYAANPSGGPGFVLTNVAIVGEGLAFFYSTKNAELANRLQLLTAQQKAMEKRKNIWKSVNLDKTVYITRNGTAFHNHDCENIQKATVSDITVAEAFERGQSPCRTCHPL